MAAVAFLVLLVVSLIGAGAYVLGKAAMVDPPALPDPIVLPAADADSADPVAGSLAADPDAPLDAVEAGEAADGGAVAQELESGSARPEDKPSAPEPPIFADPEPDVVYIQIGAVEKGIAVIISQGLRKEGFESFVAPGPSPAIFRVLIGPLTGEGAYQTAKARVEELGLENFARRYEQ